MVSFPDLVVGQPILADDVEAPLVELYSYTLDKPVGRIVQGSAQTLNDGVDTAVTFASADEIDTHGFHNPASNNSRVTPNVEGYYRFFGTVAFDAQTTGVTSECWFRLNGSTPKAPASRDVGSAQDHTRHTTIMQYMNGTTDYVELIASQNSAGADTTNVDVQYTSVLEWELIRRV